MKSLFLQTETKRHMTRYLLITTALLLTLSSCRTTKEYAYLVDAERDSAMQIVNTYTNTIHPGDQLYIQVHSSSPESVIPFNQETNKLVSASAKMLQEAGIAQKLGEGVAEGVQNLECYLVRNDGTIEFPVLGSVPAADLTIDSLENYLQRRLVAEQYVSDPIVNVRLMNFRVAVVGEVNAPQELHVEGNRLTLFEALAMCGDITLYGRRDNVTVLRKVNDAVTPILCNLQSKEFLDSPCYYLNPNDIIYVEPNKKKQKQSYRNEKIPSYLSLAVSILALTRTIPRTMQTIQTH